MVVIRCFSLFFFGTWHPACFGGSKIFFKKACGNQWSGPAKSRANRLLRRRRTERELSQLAAHGQTGAGPDDSNPPGSLDAETCFAPAQSPVLRPRTPSP